MTAEEIPPFQFTLLSRNEKAAFVGLPDGRMLGLESKHWPEAKLDWFLEPKRLLRGPSGIVYAPTEDGQEREVPITIQMYHDAASGLVAQVAYVDGQWYVLESEMAV